MQKRKSNAQIKVPREIWASVTERGQVTIPAEVRKALGLSKPGKLIFRLEGDTVVIKKPRFSTIDEIVASAPKLPRPMDWSEVVGLAHEDVAQEVHDSMQREVEDRR